MINLPSVMLKSDCTLTRKEAQEIHELLGIAESLEKENKELKKQHDELIKEVKVVLEETIDNEQWCGTRKHMSALENLKYQISQIENDEFHN